MDFISYFLDLIFSGKLFFPTGLADALTYLENMNSFYSYRLSYFGSFVGVLVGIAQLVLLIIIIIGIIIYSYEEKSINEFIKAFVIGIIIYVMASVAVCLPMLLYGYNDLFDYSQMSVILIILAYIAIAGAVAVVCGKFRELRHEKLMLEIELSNANEEDEDLDDEYESFLNNSCKVLMIEFDDDNDYYRLLLQPLPIDENAWNYAEASLSLNVLDKENIQIGSIISIKQLDEPIYNDESFDIQEIIIENY
ncbi:hypothetical protein [Breznakia pachnodae]|uniref:Uncharacterized protein n=1 Tax=Breznakia pachnodae TaxID=265178 RepID=A0ABU0E473_9FIRM|nr:hypothetical protein [Breznakia pachnodae]MDQ0361605.1 hypothetical protein [Breznakia pachnodae]